MPDLVVDDHLLRDLLAGKRGADLDGLAPDGLATTGLWLSRLFWSLADPGIVGKLSAPDPGATGPPAEDVAVNVRPVRADVRSVKARGPDTSTSLSSVRRCHGRPRRAATGTQRPTAIFLLILESRPRESGFP